MIASGESGHRCGFGALAVGDSGAVCAEQRAFRDGCPLWYAPRGSGRTELLARCKNGWAGSRSPDGKVALAVSMPRPYPVILDPAKDKRKYLLIDLRSGQAESFRLPLEKPLVSSVVLRDGRELLWIEGDRDRASYEFLDTRLSEITTEQNLRKVGLRRKIRAWRPGSGAKPRCLFASTYPWLRAVLFPRRRDYVVKAERFRLLQGSPGMDYIELRIKGDKARLRVTEDYTLAEEVSYDRRGFRRLGPARATNGPTLAFDRSALFAERVVVWSIWTARQAVLRDYGRLCFFRQGGLSPDGTRLLHVQYRRPWGPRGRRHAVGASVFVPRYAVMSGAGIRGILRYTNLEKEWPEGFDASGGRR